MVCRKTTKNASSADSEGIARGTVNPFSSVPGPKTAAREERGIKLLKNTKFGMQNASYPAVALSVIDPSPSAVYPAGNREVPYERDY